MTTYVGPAPIGWSPTDHAKAIIARAYGHPAGEVHYDGAKDEPALIQVWGMGPMTTTQAEER